MVLWFFYMPSIETVFIKHLTRKRKYGWAMCCASSCYILLLKYRFQILWTDSTIINFLCWTNNKSLNISTAQRYEIYQILVPSLRIIIILTYFVNVCKIIVT
jgi:hypothetical protein